MDHLKNIHFPKPLWLTDHRWIRETRQTIFLEPQLKKAFSLCFSPLLVSGIKATCSSLMWKCAEKSIILTLNLSIIQLYLMSSNDSYWLRYSCRLGLNLIPPQTGRSCMLSGTTSNNPPGPAAGSHPLHLHGSCSHTAASGVGSVCWSDKYPSTTGGGGGGETKRKRKKGKKNREREKDKDLFSLRWESWTV